MNIIKRILLGFRIKDTSKIFSNQTEYVISYHDPRSITWSWSLRWNPPWRLEKWHRHPLRRRITGYYSIHKQEKMIIKD